MEIKILEVAGLEPAIRAMRLPMKSGDKSDSFRCCGEVDGDTCEYCPFFEPRDDGYTCANFIGPADHDLSMKLIKAGSDHRKHIRLIDVWLEIRASRAFWSEFDTYRHGVDKVSESSVHRILKDEITVKDFDSRTNAMTIADFKILMDDIKSSKIPTVDKLNKVKMNLPEGYCQKRIVKCSYEALRNMYHARKQHQMQEWREFCKVLESLPYSEFITD